MSRFSQLFSITILLISFFPAIAPAQTRSISYRDRAVEFRQLLRTKLFSDLEFQLNDDLTSQKTTKDGFNYSTASLDYLFEPNPYHAQPSEMLNLLNAWAEKEKTSPWAKILRGVYYLQLAQNLQGRDFETASWQQKKSDYLGLAKKDLALSLKLAKQNASAHYFRFKLARLLSEKDEIKQKLFDKILEIYPGHFQAYQERLYQLSPKWGGKKKSMLSLAKQVSLKSKGKSPLVVLLPLAHKILAQQSEDSKGYFNSARVKKEYKEGFEEVINRLPQASIYSLWYAQVSFKAGDNMMAERNIYQALDRDMKNPEFYFWLGKYLLSRPNLQGALAKFSRALQLFPEYKIKAKHFTRRALVYHRLGYHQSAVTDCDKALKIEPNNSNAKKLRKIASSAMSRS